MNWRDQLRNRLFLFLYSAPYLIETDGNTVETNFGNWMQRHSGTLTCEAPKSECIRHLNFKVEYMKDDRKSRLLCCAIVIKFAIKRKPSGDSKRVTFSSLWLCRSFTCIRRKRKNNLNRKIFASFWLRYKRTLFLLSQVKPKCFWHCVIFYELRIASQWRW